jgi:hypothetical protein
MVKRLFLYERKKMLKRIENVCKRKEKKRNLLRKIKKHESYKSCKDMLIRILH